MSTIGRIAIVTGGKSRERDRSLLSGKAVSESLTGRGHEVLMLDPVNQNFIRQVQAADVAFLAIAGQYAEDGKLQGMLDSLGVPYTGSGVLASAMAMHKPTAKKVVQLSGVNVLPHVSVQDTNAADVITAVSMTLRLPVILKPCSEGGSIGVTVFHDLETLRTALTDGLDKDTWFIEPFVQGASVTCGVLEREGKVLALPPLETVPTSAEFYDYTAKRDPRGHRYRCPAAIPETALAEVKRSAIAAHQALQCSGYSRSDFLVTRDDEVFWLEANTLPGLSAGGNLATMATAAGINYHELVDSILSNTHRGGYRP